MIDLIIYPRTYPDRKFVLRVAQVRCIPFLLVLLGPVPNLSYTDPTPGVPPAIWFGVPLQLYILIWRSDVARRYFDNWYRVGSLRTGVHQVTARRMDSAVLPSIVRFAIRYLAYLSSIFTGGVMFIFTGTIGARLFSRPRGPSSQVP
jgi:hypothetical protein